MVVDTLGLGCTIKTYITYFDLCVSMEIMKQCVEFFRELGEVEIGKYFLKNPETKKDEDICHVIMRTHIRKLHCFYIIPRMPMQMNVKKQTVEFEIDSPMLCTNMKYMIYKEDIGANESEMIKICNMLNDPTIDVEDINFYTNIKNVLDTKQEILFNHVFREYRVIVDQTHLELYGEDPTPPLSIVRTDLDVNSTVKNMQCMNCKRRKRCMSALDCGHVCLCAQCYNQTVEVCKNANAPFLCCKPGCAKIVTKVAFVFL